MTEPKRSQLMSRVRQKGTTAERIVGRSLRDFGKAYRLNVRTLPGTPDFANRTGRWAIFVNGCFWHHHKACHRATIPKTNCDFWIDKFQTNRLRDARNIRLLRRQGYRVSVMWECETFDPSRLARRISNLFESGRIGCR